MSFFDEAPYAGKTVHYVMHDSDYTKEGAYAAAATGVQGGIPSNRGHHRPAVIVETWGNEKHPPEKWNVNLVVFADGMNDGYPSGTFWKTSVEFSKEGKPGTWHWPE